MLRFSLPCCRGDPTRTGDHLVPNQVRYQLRYTPIAPKSDCKVNANRVKKQILFEFFQYNHQEIDA